MLTQNEFNINNLSYTQKDFNTIYPALLEMVKKLSSKWDPTISNESDPGVILLKLDALIADKNNYNIDKNILEAFPLSVTQETNARQLYEQLGYNMKWYQAAETEITFSWQGEIDDVDITNDTVINIPRFTVCSNETDEILYTTVDGNASFTPKSGYVKCKAMQGSIGEVNLNGVTNITVDRLDSNNRVYFVDYNVAENGIFVENTGEGNYTDWNKVDNIEIVEEGTKCYKFGIDTYRNSCYIEFPNDIATLIKSGLTIKYIRTDGFEGNVNSGIISKLYNEDKEKFLTNENIKVSNYYSATDGANPEDIDSAYKNYKKTVGTFKTLVSLRDYINYIYNTGLVSNCFVCNRRDDVQTAYEIVTSDGTKEKVVFENLSDDMDAFSLKLYLLKHIDIVNNNKAYNDTFTLVKNFKGMSNDAEPNTSSTIDDVIDSIYEVKTVEHDFTSLDMDSICLIKNRYPIYCKIIPQYKMTDAEKSDVVSNIYSTLYENLNANKVDFGQELVYEELYNMIEKADSRIKTIVLDELTYRTYVTYFDSEDCVLRDMCISIPNRNIVLGGEPTDDGWKDLDGNIITDDNRLYAKFGKEEINLVANKPVYSFRYVGGQYVDSELISDTDDRFYSSAEVKSWVNGEETMSKYDARLTDGKVTESPLAYFSTDPNIYSLEVDGSPNWSYANDWFGLNSNFTLNNGVMNTYVSGDHSSIAGYLNWDYAKLAAFLFNFGNPMIEESSDDYNPNAILNKFVITRVRVHYQPANNENNAGIRTPGYIGCIAMDSYSSNPGVLFPDKFGDGENDPTLVMLYNPDEADPDSLDLSREDFIKPKWADFIPENPIEASYLVLRCDVHNYAIWAMIDEIEVYGYPKDLNSLVNYDLDIDLYEYSPQSKSMFKSMGNIRNMYKFQDIITAKCVLAGVTPLFDTDSKFTYTLNQNSEGLINNVKSVSTNTNINIDSYSDTYTLRDNEVVSLYAKNLIDKQTYSSYVKYECSFKESSIPSFVTNLGSANKYFPFVSLPGTNQAIPENGISVSGTLTAGQWYQVETNDRVKYTIQAQRGDIVVNGYKKSVTYLGYAVPYSTADDGAAYGVYLGDVGYKFGVYSMDGRIYFNAKYDSNSNYHYFIVSKYERYADNTLSPDMDYQLGSGEWVALYWKSADSNSYYDYRMLGEGEVIKPNFKMTTNIEDGKNAFEKLKGSWDGKGSRDGTTADSGSLINVAPGDSQTPTEYITNLIDSRHVLSATNSIIHRDLNEVKLTTKTYTRKDKLNLSKCLWILNKVEYINGQASCRLFSKSDIIWDDNGNGYAEYILQNGEYFLYTDINLNGLSILGSGTSIRIDISKTYEENYDFWVVPCLSMETYNTEGADSFSKSWKSLLDFSGSVTVAEMQIISIGADSQLRLVSDSPDYFNVSLNSHTAVDLSNFNILYKTASDSAWTTIPRVVLKNDGGWHGKSMLAIDTNSTTAQPLYSGQSIVFLGEDENGSTNVVGDTYLNSSITVVPPKYTPVESSGLKDFIRVGSLSEDSFVPTMIEYSNLTETSKRDIIQHIKPGTDITDENSMDEVLNDEGVKTYPGAVYVGEVVDTYEESVFYDSENNDVYVDSRPLQADICEQLGKVFGNQDMITMSETLRAKTVSGVDLNSHYLVANIPNAIDSINIEPADIKLSDYIEPSAISLVKNASEDVKTVRDFNDMEEITESTKYLEYVPYYESSIIDSMLDSEDIFSKKYDVFNNAGESSTVLKSIDNSILKFNKVLNPSSNLNILNYFELDTNNLRYTPKIDITQLDASFMGVLSTSAPANSIENLDKGYFDIPLKAIDAYNYRIEGDDVIVGEKIGSHGDAITYTLNIDVTKKTVADRKSWYTYRGEYKKISATTATSTLYICNSDSDKSTKVDTNLLDESMVMCCFNGGLDGNTSANALNPWQLSSDTVFALCMLKRIDDDTLRAYLWGFYINGKLNYLELSSESNNFNDNGYYIGSTSSVDQVSEYTLLSFASAKSLHNNVNDPAINAKGLGLCHIDGGYVRTDGSLTPLKYRGSYYFDKKYTNDVLISSNVLITKPDEESIVKYQVNYATVNSGSYAVNDTYDETIDEQYTFVSVSSKFPGAFMLNMSNGDLISGYKFYTNGSHESITYANTILPGTTVKIVFGTISFNDEDSDFEINNAVQYYYKYVKDGLSENTVGRYDLIKPMFNYFFRKDYSAIIFGNILEPMFESGILKSLDENIYNSIVNNVYSHAYVKFLVGAHEQTDIVDRNYDEEDIELSLESTENSTELSVSPQSHFQPDTCFNMIKTATNDDPIFIMSDLDVYTVGGENQIISSTDASGNETLVSFYKFRKVENQNFTKSSEDITDLEVEGKFIYAMSYDSSNIYVELYNMEYSQNDKLTARINLRCDLPKGKYIIPMYNIVSNGDNGHCLLELNASEDIILDEDGRRKYSLKKFEKSNSSDDVNSDYNMSKVYYYSLEVYEDLSEDEHIPLVLRYSTNYSETPKLPVVKRVVIKPIVKYEYNYIGNSPEVSRNATEYAEPNTQRVLDKILEIDKDGVFNFAHVVDDDIKIANPLNPISFLDVNHPYNKFTICQMDTVVSDIAVTTKIRG